jgi:hypothetical protein
MDEIRDPKKPTLSNNETKVIKIIFVIGLIYITITIFGIQLVSDEFKNYFKDNGETILSISVLLFSIVLLFAIFNVKVDDDKRKKLKKEVTIESFNAEAYDLNKYDTNSIMNGNPDIEKKFSKLDTGKVDVAFCDSGMSSDEKHANCKKLTKGNCTTVGCCVLLNGETCVGGNESGPTYLNENGKDIDVQYYIHKDTCKGKKCPQK